MLHIYFFIDLVCGVKSVERFYTVDVITKNALDYHAQKSVGRYL